ncbi:unnamed protein product [Amoebophrya sp. A120]|nr:unnamed protein product [Amoebophrya sp. A120]|eukprot:GSA120T00001703001.1
MAKQFNAKWADQVMMCFPRFIRYPNIKDERIMADAEKMNANPASQALRDRVVAEVRGKLEAAISTDAQSKQALQKVLSSPDVSTELQVKKIEVDPSGLPFPSMMSCVVMDPVKNNEFF